MPDGREIIIIDNRYSGPPNPFGYFVDLPPPVIRIPRERYIVEDQYARPDDIYYALWAGPVDYIDRPYTLDEIRYSLPLRERMPRIDLDTVIFDTGPWEVAPDQVERLALIADGINRAIAANPSEVFLIEGHTDAVGSDIDNLSLSDRRAESVALVLSQQFGVPPENLTTQGYGAHYLKIPTPGPERAKPACHSSSYHAALNRAEPTASASTSVRGRAQRLNARLWHQADITIAAIDVRFRR